MDLDNETQQRLEAVRQEQEENLLQKSNVVGVGIGEKITAGRRTGRPALTVLVEEKVPTATLTPDDRVPPSVEGVETDVIEVGTPELLTNATRVRPGIGGISIGHVNITAGTLGCLLRGEADGQTYVLSNNHVLAASNAGRFGDNLVQPGPGDAGTDPADRIATLYRYPAVSGTGDNLVDCALGRPVNPANVRAVTLDAWSGVKSIPGWFGAEDQGGDVAIGDINGSGRPDVVVFHIDNPAGENHGYYRVGWNLDANGNVSGGWSNPILIPGWFGAEDQGGGIALTDLTANDRPDLVIFHVDNPAGENHGYYRVAFDLMRTGVPARWTVA